MLIRLWLAGRRALYVPDMLIYAAVQPARLTKAYHREWYSNIGRCNARMRFEELTHPVMGLRDRIPEVARFFGAPKFAIRELGLEVWRWLKARFTEPMDTTFAHETRIRLLAAYIRESRGIQRQARRNSRSPRFTPDREPAARGEPTRSES
jgi:hypothetical protein